MTTKDLRELISYLKRTHPYPDDIFTEPTREQWTKFHELLEDNGMSSGGFIGMACRIGYNACLYQIEKTKDD